MPLNKKGGGWGGRGLANIGYTQPWVIDQNSLSGVRGIQTRFRYRSYRAFFELESGRLYTAGPESNSAMIAGPLGNSTAAKFCCCFAGCAWP